MIYLDTSALAKLVIAEPGSEEVVDLVNDGEHQPVISTLCRLELTIFGARTRCEHRVAEILGNLDTLSVTGEAWAQAELVGLNFAGRPPLRSLDAVHLGVALTTSAIKKVATFDKRLASAARAAGLGVWPTA